MTAKVYQFGKGRSKKVDLKNKPVDDVLFKPPKDEENDIREVNGIMPGSKEEYWVALALRRLDLQFVFQMPISGGRSVRGGQVIDFFVYTVPIPTPVFVQGKYWHGGAKSASSQFKVQQAQRYFGGQAQPPVEIWDEEIPDRETTYQVVKRKLA